MSKTDKTRPYHVKLSDLERRDPYTSRRERAFQWRPEFGCGHTCSCNYGSWELSKRKTRQDGKRQTLNWE